MAKYEAFISYSRSDEHLVKPLVQLLKLNGRRVFWDVASIEPGERWAERIEQALRDSEVVMILWCCHASQSEWVAREAQIALDNEKVLVPIFLCSFPVADPVGEIQGIDFTGALNHPCLYHPSPGRRPDRDLGDVQLFLNQSMGIDSVDPAEISEAWRRITHKALQRVSVQIAFASPLTKLTGGLLLLALALVRPFQSPLGDWANLLINLATAGVGVLALYLAQRERNLRRQMVKAEHVSQLLALTVEGVLRLAERGEFALRKRKLAV